MKKICAIVGSRANYSSIKSVLSAVQGHPELELQLVVGASALLDRYGAVVDLIEADGFEPVAKLHMLVEGETPLTMAKSTGLGLIELPSVFERLSPDVVVTVGDRFETMATTLAAAYMNIPVAHTMGGEVTGNIDESIRHAVTKFAHIHFAASQGAADRIIRMGERPEDVHVVGCPRNDLVVDVLARDIKLSDELFSSGVGDEFSLDEPFLLISQHPVTSEYGAGEAQITTTLEAARELGVPAVVLWPNADAGAEDIARGLRKWRERGFGHGLRFFKNLPVETYISLMARTACLIGNSSSAIREGAFIGTPAVNIGSRQSGRERGPNVIDVEYDRDAIRSAIVKQMDHGAYERDTLYGDGSAGDRVTAVLAALGPINPQKRITY